MKNIKLRTFHLNNNAIVFFFLELLPIYRILEFYLETLYEKLECLLFQN